MLKVKCFIHTRNEGGKPQVLLLTFHHPKEKSNSLKERLDLDTHYILPLGLFKAKGPRPKLAICDTGGERRSFLPDKHTHTNTILVCGEGCVMPTGFNSPLLSCLTGTGEASAHRQSKEDWHTHTHTHTNQIRHGPSILPFFPLRISSTGPSPRPSGSRVPSALDSSLSWLQSLQISEQIVAINFHL